MLQRLIFAVIILSLMAFASLVMYSWYRVDKADDVDIDADFLSALQGDVSTTNTLHVVPQACDVSKNTRHVATMAAASADDCQALCISDAFSSADACVFDNRQCHMVQYRSGYAPVCDATTPSTTNAGKTFVKSANVTGGSDVVKTIDNHRFIGRPLKIVSNVHTPLDQCRRLRGHAVCHGYTVTPSKETMYYAYDDHYTIMPLIEATGYATTTRRNDTTTEVVSLEREKKVASPTEMSTTPSDLSVGACAAKCVNDPTCRASSYSTTDQTCSLSESTTLVSDADSSAIVRR